MGSPRRREFARSAQRWLNVSTNYIPSHIRLSTWETTLRDRLGVFKKLKKEQWRMLYEDFTNRGDRPFDVYAGENLVYPWAKAWKELRRNRKLDLRQGMCAHGEMLT